jgi:hypothetical protein
VRAILRFYDLERPTIMRSSLREAAQISEHISQDARSQSYLRVIETEMGFINLQRPLAMQMSILYVPLGLEHSCQVVQAYGNVRMV